MAVKVQRNPSTGKISYNPVTNKVQTSVLTCGLCPIGITFSGITICGCHDTHDWFEVGGGGYWYGKLVGDWALFLNDTFSLTPSGGGVFCSVGGISVPSGLSIDTWFDENNPPPCEGFVWISIPNTDLTLKIRKGVGTSVSSTLILLDINHQFIGGEHPLAIFGEACPGNIIAIGECGENDGGGGWWTEGGTYSISVP